MPKKTLGFCAAICALLCAVPAGAATCGEGYYLNNGTCQACGYPTPFYCPGDDLRYPCPPDTMDWEQRTGGKLLKQFAYAWGVDSNDTPFTPGNCVASVYIQMPGGEYQRDCNYNGTDYWCDATWYYTAYAGYYLSGYLFSSYFNFYARPVACTNAPAHAHYTGPGTPDEPRAGGATDYNDCPWECDNGYGRVGNVCQPLCTAGITHLRAGDTSAPLFPVKYTSPALVIRTSGGICYGNLAAGNGTGLNMTVNGTTYRVE